MTWVDGELWHGTWEGDESDIRRIDPQSGAVLERLEMPPGTGVSGLESDGADLFYCGGGASGKVRAVRAESRRREAHDLNTLEQGAHSMNTATIEHATPIDHHRRLDASAGSPSARRCWRARRS